MGPPSLAVVSKNSNTGRTGGRMLRDRDLFVEVYLMGVLDLQLYAQCAFLSIPFGFSRQPSLVGRTNSNKMRLNTCEKKI